MTTLTNHSTFAVMRKNKRKQVKNTKKALKILELPIKTAIFFLILFVLIFQQENRELAGALPESYHFELRFISDIKSFVTLFNNIVSYLKGVY